MRATLGALMKACGHVVWSFTNPLALHIAEVETTGNTIKPNKRQAAA